MFKIDRSKLDVETVIVGIFSGIGFLILISSIIALVWAVIVRFGLPALIVGVVALAAAIYFGVWFIQRFGGD